MGTAREPLALGPQLLVAGRAAARARTHLDLWGVTGRSESRDRLLEPIDEFWEPLRFVEHAQLVAYCVTICTIFDKRRGTLRLNEICRELGCEEKLEHLLPVVAKVKHLRDNIFAHRNISTSWEAAFAEAAITPDQMEKLADGTLSIVNELLMQEQLLPVRASSLPRDEFERLLTAGSSALYRSIWHDEPSQP